MNPKTIVAVILIALGVVAFAYQGINYTTRGPDVNNGPAHMTAEHSRRLPLPPIVGAIGLIGGMAMLLVDKRNLYSPAASATGAREGDIR